MGRKVCVLSFLALLQVVSCFAAQRTNRLDLTDGATASGILRVYEDTDDGSNYSDITVGALAASYTLTIPDQSGVIAVTSDIVAPSDTAYAASWNGVGTIAPSKNAVYDKIESLDSPFQTTTGVANLVTAGNTVSIGTSTAGGKLFIDGDADEIQLQVQGNATQTSSLVVFENSAGTDVVTISGDGTTVYGSGNGSLDIGSAGIRLTSDGDGALTLLGMGDGSDENLIINLDDTSNVATITSGTALATVNFSSIGIQESGVNVPTTIDICKTIETPTNTDTFLVHRASKAQTITNINCIVEAETSATIRIDECDTAGDNCSGVDGATTIACDVTGEADDGSLSNAGIDATDWVRLVVTATSGTPGHVTACFTAVDA